MGRGSATSTAATGSLRATGTTTCVPATAVNTSPEDIMASKQEQASRVKVEELRHLYADA